jgi:type II secretory pathway pseudopilin PulG
MMKPFFPLSRFLTRPPAQMGYTLMELLAVVSIMALSAAVMAPVLTGNLNQAGLTRTLESMANIRRAILGAPSAMVRGDIRFNGYVVDMGALPDLIDQNGRITHAGGQPRGLWTRDLDGDGIADLAAPKHYAIPETHRIDRFPRENVVKMGWRGPYITRAVDKNVLQDGWGNPFRFEKTGDGLTVTSLGADGKPGGAGADADLHLRISKKDYTGVVAGYLSPFFMLSGEKEAELAGYRFPDGRVSQATVEVYHAPSGPDCPLAGAGGPYGDYPLYNMLDCVSVKKAVADADGYFRIEGVPVGHERIITATQAVVDDGGGLKKLFCHHRIDVEPGINWMGIMGRVE